MASQQEKEAAVAHGKKIFERIEEGCDKLITTWIKGFELGMLNKNELDHIVNDTEVVKHMVLSLHCRGTAIAQRAGADGVIIAGGPGR